MSLSFLLCRLQLSRSLSPEQALPSCYILLGMQVEQPLKSWTWLVHGFPERSGAAPKANQCFHWLLWSFHPSDTVSLLGDFDSAWVDCWVQWDLEIWLSELYLARASQPSKVESASYEDMTSALCRDAACATWLTITAVPVTCPPWPDETWADIPRMGVAFRSLQNKCCIL